MKTTIFTDTEAYIHHWERLNFDYSFESNNPKTYTRLHETADLLITYSENPVSQGHFFDDHFSSTYYILRFLIAGEEIYFHQGNKVIIKANDCLISQPARLGNYSRKQASTGINIIIPKTVLSAKIHFFSKQAQKISCSSGINKIAFDYTVSFEQELQRLNELESQLVMKNYLDFLTSWLNQFDAKENDDFSRIIQLIDQNLTNSNFDLKQLSQEFGRSTRTIQTILKQHDLTFSRYLADKRLLEASKELLTSRLKIIEIANKWGFYDGAHFNKAFREAYHCTPSQYQRKYRSLDQEKTACWLSQ